MNFNYIKKTISTTDSKEDTHYNYLSSVMLESLRDNMEMVEKMCSDEKNENCEISFTFQALIKKEKNSIVKPELKVFQTENNEKCIKKLNNQDFENYSRDNIINREMYFEIEKLSKELKIATTKIDRMHKEKEELIKRLDQMTKKRDALKTNTISNTMKQQLQKANRENASYRATIDNIKQLINSNLKSRDINNNENDIESPIKKQIRQIINSNEEAVVIRKTTQ